LADVVLRPMRPDDVERLVQITAETGFFYKEEVEVAQGVLEEAAAGEASGYQVQVAVQNGDVAGYVCFGPTPLTRGTWDIYWIAVDTHHQNQGIGRTLMQAAEEAIGAQKGRLILVETSSRDLYEPTRRFYRAMDYKEESYISDFYDVGDGRVTYTKALPWGGQQEMPP